MEDQFEQWPIDPAEESARASAWLGYEVEFVACNLPDAATLEELRGILAEQERINVRVRQITGINSVRKALKHARDLVDAGETTVAPVEPPARLSVPDDRDPSVSVRALRGGLPSLGRKR